LLTVFEESSILWHRLQCWGCDITSFNLYMYMKYIYGLALYHQHKSSFIMKKKN